MTLGADEGADTRLPYALIPIKKPPRSMEIRARRRSGGGGIRTRGEPSRAHR